MTAPAAADRQRADILRRFMNDRIAAHRILFKHRHSHELTEAHDQFIRDWHSMRRYILTLAFRGFAKSTLAEEGILLGAGFREFKNLIIIGANETKAAERLYAIRHEIKNNEPLAQLFGDLRGPMDTDTKIILSNDVMIQAVGRGQALRGVKHLDQRPDFFFVDDLETKSDIKTVDARDETARWLIAELIPACDPQHRGRVAATPLDADALPMRLAKDRAWTTRVYPVLYPDEDGELTPTWPERFPLGEVEIIRNSFVTAGLLRDFDMEYMCEASSPADKPFKSDMFRVNPVPRTWQAVYCMFDPARTVKKTSATTGFAAWSWIGRKLVVWDAWGKRLMPDEIVNEIFAADEAHTPTVIGVEADGLNEFLMQPIRHAMIERGTIPIRAYKAPVGKLDFIRALQPFFIAREIEFARDMPEVKAQFLSFPTGAIDVPNALAYALKMRPGAPFYDGFHGKHVSSSLKPARNAAPWLCLNATRGLTTAVLAQLIDGAVRVYADWVREGDAPDRLLDIVKEANLECGRPVKLVAHPKHWEKFNNVGLVQAARHIPMEIRRGADIAIGRAEIRRLLERDIRGAPAVLIDDTARWTLNAFAGGYTRTLSKQGTLTDETEDNQYRVLMEGLEAFCALLKAGGSPDGEDDDRVYGVTPNGAKYVTARR